MENEVSTMAMAEADAQNQIIVYQPDGVMNDLLNQYNCGLHYSNANELYDCIVKLKKDSRLVQTMKANSRKLYEERFDASKVYREYADYIISEDGLDLEETIDKVLELFE